MSRNLYCELYQKHDNQLVKVKDFNHFSYYTRDFFDDATDFSICDLDFPSFDMQTGSKKINKTTVEYSFIKLPYHKIEKIIEHLKKIKEQVRNKFYSKNDNETGVFFIEDYGRLKHIIEELEYCLLYSKYELEDDETVFEFTME